MHVSSPAISRSNAFNGRARSSTRTLASPPPPAGAGDGTSRGVRIAAEPFEVGAAEPEEEPADVPAPAPAIAPVLPLDAVDDSAGARLGIGTGVAVGLSGEPSKAEGDSVTVTVAG